MRRTFYVAFLIAAGACANAEDASSPPASSDGGPPAPDGGVLDSAPEDAPDAAAPSVSICSDVGWCATVLPDTDIELKDIWPLEHRAFAVAESPVRGAKVLEWNDGDSGWQYIDDDTQNGYAQATLVGGLWAPNDSELYFTASPNGRFFLTPETIVLYVYHGKRSLSGWSWERQQLTPSRQDYGARRHSDTLGGYLASFGVWGPSASEVYAWAANTIFRWKSEDGGPASWVAEYVADDVDRAGERFFFLSAGGSGPDDVWFAGSRGDEDRNGCPIVVRKTAGAYQRIADGIAVPFGNCRPRVGVGILDGRGYLTDIQSTGVGRVVGLQAGRSTAWITAEDGGYAMGVSPVVAHLSPFLPAALWSLFVHDERAWLSGTGWVVRGANEPDAGPFEFSTISREGVPEVAPLYRVRGTSNTNLWVIGGQHALHKTTP